jgi:hypothetical protein
MAHWINDRRREVLYFCPYAFTFPNLPDINEPSRCEMFNNANYAQEAMNEFLNSLVPGLNGRPIVDYRPKGGIDPEDSYGPWEAM